MALLVNPTSDAEAWKTALERELPGEELRFWPDIGDPAEIECAIAWLLPRDALRSMVNLQAILSLGAGAEQWLRPGIPDVPVVRLADPAMADEMAAYTLAWVIRHQRRFADSEALQRAGEWQIPASPETSQFRVGILGHGTIGSRIGRAFADLGFPVNAWVRTPRTAEGVELFAGLEQLDAFLAASDAVVNVLPSTDETVGLLDAARLALLPEGSIFVNIGRGTVLADEADLIAALDRGPLARAVLDVTAPEPPADHSPLFAHPAVTLTAHLSGITGVTTAARLIAANIRRLRAGEEPVPLLDRSRGY